MRFIIFHSLFLLLIPSLATAGEPSREAVEFFEKKIRPVLVDNCFKCHTGPKLKGHLALGSRVAILKGGDSGPALVPGQPAKSLIVKAIRYDNPDLRMPPRGKLPEQVILDIEAWITMGAPWPDDTGTKIAVKNEFNLKERAKYWSLQPLASPAPPQVKNQAWVKSGIDAFILDKLEAKGLTPAAVADKRTLMRRVTFDLIGLPPTAEEIDNFLKDDSPQAFAKVVDRLLASPHYGERWARHWLDLARYAETYGHEFDFEIPEAYRYRDYVIRAFNADVPYDQFVTEHVAGDLLPTPRRHATDKTNESVQATGFWFLGEAKHGPVDVRADQADRIDNQIDVFGKTFLGMTIACARCHDHKFDAISTKDYYGLAGFVQSSRQDRAFIDDPAPRREKIKKLRDLVNEYGDLGRAAAVRRLLDQLPQLGAAVFDPSGYVQRQGKKPANPFHLQAQHPLKTQEVKGVIFADFRKNAWPDWIVTGEAFGDRPTLAGDLAMQLGQPNPVQGLLRPGLAHSGILSAYLQGTLRSPTFTISHKKIHYRVASKQARVNLILDGLQLIRTPIYGDLAFTPKSDELHWRTQDVSMWIGQRAYIEVLDDGAGQAALEQVVFSDESPPAPRGNALLHVIYNRNAANADAFVANFQRDLKEIVEDWAAGKLADRADAADRVDILNALLRGVKPAKGAEAPEKLRTLSQEIRALELALAAPRRVLGMADGTAVDEYVFLRGNHKKPGETVPRRFLEVFGGAEKPPPAQGSGRLELAKTMTDPTRTPLLPRVLVNRLWKHHFGEGIVRSPDDFGVLGQAPTHPELLDLLAGEFVKNGWSIKKMHRLMLLSNAYQMASASEPKADEADPDNKLLHKMPVRRLEAEAIRDALLLVSGRIDRTLFGPSVPPHLSAFMVGRGRPAVSGPLDGNGRRSIYLAVRRNFLNPMFLAFDYPTPFSAMGKRGVSNVPAQALTMMNNPLVLEQADLWAKKTLAEPGLTPRQRLDRMYVAALGRPPSEPEATDALTFVEELARANDPRAWADLAHVLFNLKEFIFVN